MSLLCEEKSIPTYKVRHICACCQKVDIKIQDNCDVCQAGICEDCAPFIALCYNRTHVLCLGCSRSYQCSCDRETACSLCDGLCGIERCSSQVACFRCSESVQCTQCNIPPRCLEHDASFVCRSCDTMIGYCLPCFKFAVNCDVVSSCDSCFKGVNCWKCHATMEKKRGRANLCPQCDDVFC
jgi:hypothetical protein